MVDLSPWTPRFSGVNGNLPRTPELLFSSGCQLSRKDSESLSPCSNRGLYQFGVTFPPGKTPEGSLPENMDTRKPPLLPTRFTPGKPRTPPPPHPLCPLCPGRFAPGELLCVYRGKSIPLAQVLKGTGLRPLRTELRLVPCGGVLLFSNVYPPLFFFFFWCSARETKRKAMIWDFGGGTPKKDTAM